jgi:hypothetical protein
MLSQEEIDEQQRLLATYRHTLAIYLKQRAMIGQAYSPPALITGIEEARGNIKRIKTTLKAQGVVVPDDPDDESTTATYIRPAALSTPSQPRRLWVWFVAIDTIVLALALGGWWWFNGQSTNTPSQGATVVAQNAPSAESPVDVTPSDKPPASEPSTADLESQLEEANISLSETQVETVRGFINDPRTGYKSFVEHVLPLMNDQKFHQTLYLDEIEFRYTQQVGAEHYSDFDEAELKAGMVQAWNDRYTDQHVDSFDQIVEARS